MKSVFVYTREAHPGEHWPAHDSLDAKRDQAREASERWELSRPMLIDDLEGSVHRAYGCLPNMSWVIDTRGTAVYRANWTDARTLSMAVDQLLWEQDRRAEGAMLTPFSCDWAPRRLRDQPAFVAGLLRAGPTAQEEFVAAARATGWPRAAIEQLLIDPET